MTADISDCHQYSRRFFRESYTFERNAENVEPFPKSEAAFIYPPQAVIISRARYSPTPTPGLSADWAARQNRPNTFGKSSSRMPRPVSVTSTRILIISLLIRPKLKPKKQRGLWIAFGIMLVLGLMAIPQVFLVTAGMFLILALTAKSKK